VGIAGQREGHFPDAAQVYARGVVQRLYGAVDTGPQVASPAAVDEVVVVDAGLRPGRAEVGYDALEAMPGRGWAPSGRAS